MRVFITGGTGLIGTRLIRRLRERGDEVVALTRRPAEAKAILAPGCTIVEGDPATAGAWTDTLAGCDGVLHLAGENIFARRWNDEFKARLVESRVKSTQTIVQALARHGGKVLVNAAAIGIYGPHGDEELDEDSPPGSDFLARLCVQWEEEAHKAETHGIRTALVRVGIVLDREGGALAQMLTPFKLCLGGPIGGGRQWMSWIHHADIVGLFLHALDTPGASGPLNGTAPQPATNRDFTKALGRALGRPTIFPLPAFMLKLRFGEVADVLASGQRVLPRRSEQSGYRFQFPTLDAALADVLR